MSHQGQPDFKLLAPFYLADETTHVKSLIKQADLSAHDLDEISKAAHTLLAHVKKRGNKPPLMDALLQEYSLSSAEGIALMRLSEALLRTPDAGTSNYLIRDKLAGGNWKAHKKQSPSALVNLATRGLIFADGWIDRTGGAAGKGLLAKISDPVLRLAMDQAMRMMGNHFVLGRNIGDAMEAAESDKKQGFSFSYDMLGEAALTHGDAERYFAAYEHALQEMAKKQPKTANFDRFKVNAPGADSISVKLSALHPRYEFTHADDCVPALTKKMLKLAKIAKAANLALTIDAEEADRLELQLWVFDNLLRHPDLAGWDGLGLAVQAYSRRGMAVIEWLSERTQAESRKICVRLVKGAYWDMEIKRAQEMGLPDYPVFTRKENTDVSYLACAKKMLSVADHIYPQFATHNVQSVAAIHYMAQDCPHPYEFQKLDGMGTELHEAIIQDLGGASRIYAPVGAHPDLLPYLVRRLLENGANSSFVNQLSNEDVSADELLRDPIKTVQAHKSIPHPNIPRPQHHLSTGRKSGVGIDWTQSDTFDRVTKALAKTTKIKARPIINGKDNGRGSQDSTAPYDTRITVGQCVNGNAASVEKAVAACKTSSWPKTSAKARSKILYKAADLLERDFDLYMNLCVHEAGKAVPDAVAEIREAVDFCRYYADQILQPRHQTRTPIGIIGCISPWNFPLAIYLGQIVGSLAAGNTVIAKPAEETPLIAYQATKLLLEAGVPPSAIHFIPGDGGEVGAAMTAHPDIAGICFTGSTQTAKVIHKSLAQSHEDETVLIAETGGINAMIIDSTALLEQAVGDVMAAAFQSAGQRCSACRIVCVQEDVASRFEEMLVGAMAALRAGPPTILSSDVGPVIDGTAHKMLTDYIREKKAVWPVIAETRLKGAGEHGFFVRPIAFRVENLSDVTREIFGPVLHVVTFKSGELESLIDKINGLGFGLTFGLHSRIDDRVARVTAQAQMGNVYVNRNQIGAVVGVQPFGGEGLSGTGPKAGGPLYLLRLSRPKKPLLGREIELDRQITLPGPTGESNELTLHPRGRILSLGGPDAADLDRQTALALLMGNEIISVSRETAEALTTPEQIAEALSPYLEDGFDAVASDWPHRQALDLWLSGLNGPILPILSGQDDPERYAHEKTITIDTTAAGGNASLLAGV